MTNDRLYRRAHNTREGKKTVASNKLQTEAASAQNFWWVGTAAQSLHNWSTNIKELCIHAAHTHYTHTCAHPTPLDTHPHHMHTDIFAHEYLHINSAHSTGTRSQSRCDFFFSPEAPGYVSQHAHEYETAPRTRVTSQIRQIKFKQTKSVEYQ